tara:strand:- start:243 stop:1367 length:1125 start_codon:yes stop_codon:yes gene_type:complete
MRKYRYFLKVFSINLFIFIFSIIFIDLLFGNWFNKYSWNYLLRSHKDKKIEYTVKLGTQTFEFDYVRNKYGFREKNFDPKDVEIVFLGGSTGNERFLPYELTIVGRLNSYFKKQNLPKIYNASVDGHSSVGFINSFYKWFPIIKGLKPKIYIIYLGINERYYLDFEGRANNPNDIFFKKKVKSYIPDFDLLIADNKKKQISNYIKNNSFFFQKGKIVQLKYFPEKVSNSFDTSKFNPKYNFVVDENVNFLNNLKVEEKFKNIVLSDIEILYLKSLNKRLEILTNLIKENNGIPIYINQVLISGQNRTLYITNKTIQEYCEKNNLEFINLASKIKDMKINDFYDEFHTTDTGSQKISNEIKHDLEKIIMKVFNKI